MSVYKEFYYAAQAIQQASRQVFMDAADWGVPVKKDDKYWNLSQEIKRYFDPETDKREVARYATGSSVNMFITVFNEMDGSYAEEIWRMNYTTVRENKFMDGILSIERVSRKKSTHTDY